MAQKLSPANSIRVNTSYFVKIVKYSPMATSRSRGKDSILCSENTTYYSGNNPQRVGSLLKEAPHSDAHQIRAWARSKDRKSLTAPSILGGQNLYENRC